MENLKQNKTTSFSKEKTYLIIIWIVIVVYPLVNSFLGIDLGDTGYHYYAYEHIFSNPEQLSFTAFFTYVIGWLWVRLFPFLGLWGLNLLEVVMEISLSIIIYYWLKPYLGKITTSIGILLAVIATGTYLNIFNYHQFNVFLLSVLLYLEFEAYSKGKKVCSFFGGIMYGCLIASRMGSVTAIVTLVLYLLWWLSSGDNFKSLISHYFIFFLGTLFFLAVMAIVLGSTGQLHFFINNIFRLGKLAGDSGTGYSFDKLLRGFVLGNLKAMVSGGLFLLGSVILFFAINSFLNKTDNKKKNVFNYMCGLVLLGLSVFFTAYSYVAIKAPRWPQMTTGPSFTVGVLYVIVMIVSIYHLLSKNKNPKIFMICMSSLFLTLLTVAGSSTETKHTVLAMWIMFPVCIYFISRLCSKTVQTKINNLFENVSLFSRRSAIVITTMIMCCAFLGKFFHMVYCTTNFDSTNRLELTESINSDKTKWLKTTKREADSVNGVLDCIRSIPDYKDRKLVVFGGSIMFYSMLDMDSYVQPWFSNAVYDNSVLQDDLVKAYEDNEKLPIVIYCRTNNNYGFYEELYTVLINSQKANSYAGKKDIFTTFLYTNNYTMEYLNNYYMVILPEDIAVNDISDYKDIIY